jgi:hypothetical protein
VRDRRFEKLETLFDAVAAVNQLLTVTRFFNDTPGVPSTFPWDQRLLVDRRDGLYTANRAIQLYASADLREKTMGLAGAYGAFVSAVELQPGLAANDDALIDQVDHLLVRCDQAVRLIRSELKLK